MPMQLTYALLFITGIITSVTDISRRKILNHHLLIIGLAGLGIQIFSLPAQMPHLSTQLLNLGTACILGIILYFKSLWRAGDAKLFFLYSLLMPPTGYEYLVPLPCLSLFANAFLTGLIVLLPYLIYNTAHNRDKFSYKTIASYIFGDFGKAVTNTFCLSWIIFPLLATLKVSQYGVVSFILIYFLVDFILDTIKRTFLARPPIFIAILVLGLTLRFLYDPQFFAWGRMFIYLRTVCLYSFFFITLRALANQIRDPKDKVPFALLLFAGCLESYTPFLTWAIRLISFR